MAKILTDQIHLDTVKSIYGTGSDLEIYHSGAHSFIRDVGTGSLYLQTNGSAIFLQDTDGNAMAQFTDGGGSFLMYNGDLKLSTTSTGISITGGGTFTGSLDVDGTESDIAIVGGSMNFKDANDYIRITKASASAQIGLFRSGSGAGGMYIGAAADGFRLFNDGFAQKLLVDQSGNATFSGTTKATAFLINRTSAAGIGASLGDINGAELGPGYLSLSRDDTADAKQIVFEKNDTEHSYLQTTSSGLTIGGADATFTGNIDLPDNKRLRFGNQDLQIFHSSMGTGSFIQESGPGSLEIYSDTGVNIRSGVLGENFATFTKDGPIELYYDNSKKFETTSAGITVTGNIVVSSTVDGRDIASDGSKLDGISSNARTGTVTSVSVGTGLDIQNSTTTPSITVDLSELNDIDGDDPQITDFVVVSNEDESARCNLANTKIALGADKTQVLLNANFSDDSSTTSYLYVPYNSTSETTSAQYYVHWAAPGTGKFKRIIMQHVYGSMSSSFTTQLKLTKNALSTTTSAELTPSNGTTDGTYIQFDPSGSNASFVKGDRFTIAYQKSSSSKYWRGVAFSVIIELDKI